MGLLVLIVFLAFAVVRGAVNLLRPEYTLRLRLVKKARRQKDREEANRLRATPLSEFSAPDYHSKLRFLRATGALWLGFGLWGLFTLHFSLGFGGVPETGGEASPALARIVRERCAPLISPANGQVSALAVAVISGTNELTMTFGRYGIASATPISTNTFFEIGSMTKTFTAISFARLIEQGVVQLDEPVTNLMPAGFVLSPAASSVTLRNLTTHTSGFPRLPQNLSIAHALLSLFTGGDPYASYTLADFREALAHVAPETPRGTKLEYSNFGTGLLGWLLSQKLGLDYQAYIETTVCEPLHLHDTKLHLDSAETARFAQGYRSVSRLGPFWFGLRSQPWELPDHFTAAGGIRSTIADMLLYLRANLHPGTTALSNAITTSHQMLFEKDASVAIGMNWLRYKSTLPGKVLIWHNGGTGGFRSFIGFTEDGSIGVCLLANSSVDVDTAAKNILKDLNAALAK